MLFLFSSKKLVEDELRVAVRVGHVHTCSLD